MQHRYGRHGYDAWLRLQKRRVVAREERSLVPIEHSIISIHIHMEGRERVFIVSLSNNEFTNLPTQTVVGETSTGEIMAFSSNNRHPRWEHDAAEKASTRFGEDLQKGAWPTREELSRGARGEAYKIFNDIRAQPERAILIGNYAEAYIRVYEENYRLETKEGSLDTELARHARAKALQERDYFLSIKQDLSCHQICIIATIYAQSVLPSSNLNLHLPQNLEEIDQIVHIFRQTFFSSEKEVQRGYTSLSEEFSQGS